MRPDFLKIPPETRTTLFCRPISGQRGAAHVINVHPQNHGWQKMADIIQLEQHRKALSSETTPGPADAYARSLIRDGEIVDLILALEAIAAGGQPDKRGIDAVGKLTQATGLRLDDETHIRSAILVLGERAEALRSIRKQAGARPPAPIDKRSAEAVTRGLMGVLEAARGRWIGEPDLSTRLHAEAQAALEVYQRNLPGVGDERWWTEMSEATHERLVPGFLAIAPRLTQAEEHPVGGSLLRSPALMAALVALPGLLTWPLAVSTPLVVVILALVGAFAIHPVWVEHVARPLRTLEAALSAEGSRIDRLSGVTPWREEDFTISGVLNDLVPMLEAKQLGKAGEEELRQVITDYFDELEAPFGEFSQRNERYLHHLRVFCEGTLLKRWQAHGRAQRALETRPIGPILDRPWASALTLGILTLPIDWLAARVSPLPQPVDLPLMLTLFVIAGAVLPRSIPGTHPARKALIEELGGRQGELDALP